MRKPTTTTSSYHMYDLCLMTNSLKNRVSIINKTGIQKFYNRKIGWINCRDLGPWIIIYNKRKSIHLLKSKLIALTATPNDNIHNEVTLIMQLK